MVVNCSVCKELLLSSIKYPMKPKKFSHTLMVFTRVFYQNFGDLDFEQGDKSDMMEKYKHIEISALLKMCPYMMHVPIIPDNITTGLSFKNLIFDR